MHDASTLTWIIFFAVSWAGAGAAIWKLLTDGQPNPAAQYACLVDLVLAAPMMAVFGLIGMIWTVVIHIGVMLGAEYLTLKK